jgi:alpha-L-fucosidase
MIPKIKLPLQFLSGSLLVASAIGATAADTMTPERHQAALKPLLETMDKVNRSGPFQPSVESLEKYRVPEWYADAKFGIFVHYGIISAHNTSYKGCWYGNFMYRGGHPVNKMHIEKYGPQEKFGYKDFVPMLAGGKFNADEWVGLFKEAGARFVVPVSCFHDGFAMWNSKLTDWNAVNMGPKFDYDGLLSAAVRKQGLKFGVAWHAFFRPEFFRYGRHPGTDIQPPYAGTPWSFYGPDKIDRPFIDDCLGRLVELVDGYQPDLVWFDFDSGDVDRADLRRFASFYFNRAAEWKKDVAINDKSESTFPRCIVLDYERGKTSVMRPDLWQTDTSVSWKDWSYIPEDRFKGADELIRELVDIVSKNGVLLLNVGPRPDGTIPEQPQALLRSIGAWLKVNGEAIYGTRPCWALGFGEGSHNSGGGGFSDRAVQYEATDFRFTRKGNAIYAIAMAWPASGDHFLIKSFNDQVAVTSGRVTGVELLGAKEPLKWKLTGEGLWIDKPAQCPCETAVAFKITMSGVCLEKLEARRLDDQKIKLDVTLRNLDAQPQKHEVSFFANQAAIGRESFSLDGQAVVSRSLELPLRAADNVAAITASFGAKPFALVGRVADPAPGSASYKFDRSSTLSASGLGRLDSFTLSLWVRPDRLNEKSTAIINTLSEKPSGMNLQFIAEGGVQLMLWNAEGADTKIQTASLPDDVTRWRHVTASYDAASHALSIYINGKLDARRVAERQTAVDLAALTIGGGRDKERRLSGQLADVRIYGRALPAADVQAVVRGGAVDGLVAAWNFKQQDAAKIPDVSGHQHDATVEK